MTASLTTLRRTRTNRLETTTDETVSGTDGAKNTEACSGLLPRAVERWAGQAHAFAQALLPAANSLHGPHITFAIACAFAARQLRLGDITGTLPDLGRYFYWKLPTFCAY